MIFNISSHSFFRRFKVVLGTNNQPLLGRSEEISEFENFISHYNSGRPTNLFLVCGSARVGKTRLITELISVAERVYSEQSTSGKHGRLVRRYPLVALDQKGQEATG